MNILYYHWGEVTSADLLLFFEEAGYPYTKVSFPLAGYEQDESFEAQIDELLTKHTFHIIFTFDYFPVLSKIAEKYAIPYISWVYDCPHFTLYSRRVTSPNTYFFLFDRTMCDSLTQRGAKHVFHLPLAVGTSRLQRQLPGSVSNADLKQPISFVGSLYEDNFYRKINYLPPHLHGYLEGIMNARQKIWGGSLLSDLLSDNIMKEVQTFLSLGDNKEECHLPPKEVFLSMLEQEVTCRDRTLLLSLSSDRFETHLYSASNASRLPGCVKHGYISYLEEMPRVFRQSKINLNITLRSIHSGIPLRCLDIMGAGGFLLSNYQPELFEYFIPDEEFVSYESEADMLEKIAYYLSNESRRAEIAERGCAKIAAEFSYPVLFGHILNTVFP